MYASLITDSLNINLVNNTIQSHKDYLSFLVLIFVYLYVWIAVRKLTQNKKHHLCLTTELKYLQVCGKIWKILLGGGEIFKISLKKIITLLRHLEGKNFFEDLRADL